MTGKVTSQAAGRTGPARPPSGSPAGRLRLQPPPRRPLPRRLPPLRTAASPGRSLSPGETVSGAGGPDSEAAAAAARASHGASAQAATASGSGGLCQLDDPSQLNPGWHGVKGRLHLK